MQHTRTRHILIILLLVWVLKRPYLKETMLWRPHCSEVALALPLALFYHSLFDTSPPASGKERKEKSQVWSVGGLLVTCKYSRCCPHWRCRRRSLAVTVRREDSGKLPYILPIHFSLAVASIASTSTSKKGHCRRPCAEPFTLPTTSL